MWRWPRRTRRTALRCCRVWAMVLGHGWVWWTSKESRLCCCSEGSIHLVRGPCVLCPLFAVSTVSAHSAHSALSALCSCFVALFVRLLWAALALVVESGCQGSRSLGESCETAGGAPPEMCSHNTAKLTHQPPRRWCWWWSRLPWPWRSPAWPATARLRTVS